MPLYTNASICFPAYGLCFSFEPRKPAAFVRTASSFEGRENHKLCLFCLKWEENIGIICWGGIRIFKKEFDSVFVHIPGCHSMYICVYSVRPSPEENNRSGNGFA